MSQANKTKKSYELKEGDECNIYDGAQYTAHLRPVVIADLSNILFTTGTDNKSMNGDPQNEAVTLTMYDPNIKLDIPQDQLTVSLYTHWDIGGAKQY